MTCTWQAGAGTALAFMPLPSRMIRTMFTTLRDKLLFGLTPLLAITLGLGVWAVAMFNRLGQRIDVILRGNDHSVLGAEGMKEAPERMDPAAQFALGGQDDRRPSR